MHADSFSVGQLVVHATPKHNKGTKVWRSNAVVLLTTGLKHSDVLLPVAITSSWWIWDKVIQNSVNCLSSIIILFAGVGSWQNFTNSLQYGKRQTKMQICCHVLAAFLMSSFYKNNLQNKNF